MRKSYFAGSIDLTKGKNREGQACIKVKMMQGDAGDYVFPDHSKDPEGWKKELTALVSDAITAAKDMKLPLDYWTPDGVQKGQGEWHLALCWGKTGGRSYPFAGLQYLPPEGAKPPKGNDGNKIARKVEAPPAEPAKIGRRK